MIGRGNCNSVVEKWIRSTGAGGINVVSLFKFGSDETSIDPERGRGGLFFVYGAVASRFGGACGFYFAYPRPGGAFRGCDRLRVR